MKKTICIVTATRAEYGLLKPLIIRLREIPEFDVRVVATGAHLSPEHGKTFREIEADGIPIDAKIDILLNADSAAAVSKSMGLAMIGFAGYFEKTAPDFLVVLGDRYEILAVCCAAMNQRIPIAHLYGGETTEGALDEGVRHAITKLSYLHFTSTAEYRERVIQLGEHPDRVFSVGALGIENILNEPVLSKAQVEEAIDFQLDKPYALVTFHPVTLEQESVDIQFRELLTALDRQKKMKFVFTMPNADAGNRTIRNLIKEYVAIHENAVAYDSLGSVLYHNAIRYSLFVIGNSSSGLIEAPSLHVPTINIGDRQKGRLQAGSVINCKPYASAIEEAILLAASEKYQKIAADVVNPYGDGATSQKMADTIRATVLSEKIDLKKKFYKYEA